MSATEEELMQTLDAIGAAGLPHADSRSLSAHLLGTRALLIRWGAPEHVSIAGMFHSVYSTESYRLTAVSYENRKALAEMIGTEAEDLVYLFSRIKLRNLMSDSTRKILASGPDSLITFAEHTSPDLSVKALGGIYLMHAANLADQAQTRSGSPGVWLGQLCTLLALAKLCGVSVPAFSNGSQALPSYEYELSLRDVYSAAIGEIFSDEPAAIQLLSRCISPLIKLAEPLVWLSWLEHRRGQLLESQRLAKEALSLLEAWGVAWDKRLAWNEWLDVAASLAAGDAMLRDTALTALASRSAPRGLFTLKRAERYFRSLEDNGVGDHSSWYPELESKPWHDAERFGLAGALKSDFELITREVEDLSSDGFHDEAEAIDRTGKWEVFMLYEAGIKNVQHCARCPNLTRIIDADPTIRTSAGLIYLSRLKARSEIAAHRGPTNLRLRCHLGISIPAGDCGIRVGSESRRWKAGECLVFDDFFEHEAWNRTDEDRVVLVVDMWHPSLTAGELSVLKAIDQIVGAQTRSRLVYLERNRKMSTATH